MTWQSKRIMTASELAMFLHRTRLTRKQMAAYLGLTERMVQYYVSGHAVIPPPVALLLQALVVLGEQPVIPPEP